MAIFRVIVASFRLRGHQLARRYFVLARAAFS